MNKSLSAALLSLLTADGRILGGSTPYRVTNTVRHRSLPLSRNAPCPCGSGKKFKTCCRGRRGPLLK